MSLQTARGRDRTGSARHRQRGFQFTREQVREVLPQEMDRIHQDVGDGVLEKGRPRDTVRCANGSPWGPISRE